VATARQRKLIFAKSKGKCWYCGCDLSCKKWQVDHIVPVCSRWRDGVDKETVENINNKVPSCPACNKGKGFLSVESFRRRIRGLTISHIKKSAKFKLGSKYGQFSVSIHDTPVVFWFEKQGL